MSSINTIVLCGNVGADAEVRTLDGGTKVARMRVATSTGGYRKQDGTEVPERTEWHSVTCWRGLASLAEHVKKGMKVTVVGRLVYNEYEKNGEKRTAAEIIASELVLHGEKKEAVATAPVAEAPMRYDNDLPF